MSDHQPSDVSGREVPANRSETLQTVAGIEPFLLRWPRQSNWGPGPRRGRSAPSILLTASTMAGDQKTRCSGKKRMRMAEGAVDTRSAAPVADRSSCLGGVVL